MGEMEAVSMISPGSADLVEDMALGAPEVTVISENEDEVNAVGQLKLDSAIVGDVVDEILAKVTEGVPTKKVKENDQDDMEVDDGGNQLSSENKENILQVLKKMTRKELEDVVLFKTVEALVKQSEVGKFRTKMLEMQLNKERMQQRVTHLQKQVVEMGKAVKLLLDNQSRDPNNLNPNKKRPPPIKFYRSVGLQVTIEPSVRNGISKVIHVNNANGIPLNGVVKPLNGTTVHNIPPGIVSTKRPGPKSLTDPRAMKSPPNHGFTQAVAKGLNQMNGHLSPSKVATNINVSNNVMSKPVSSPTVVDLTDDVTTVDGVSNVFRLVNTGSGGYQLVSNGQSRHLLVAQNTGSAPISAGRPISAVVVKNVMPTSNKPVQFGQPKTQGVPFNRATTVVTTIPNRPIAAAVVKQQQNQSQLQAAPRKIQLPGLPSSAVVPIPRGRILKDLPPKPTLTLNEQHDGIVLSWTMKLSLQHAEIASYQIYACQESLATSPGKTSTWKKVGDVKALPLPMACTLSQFTQGNRYFFIVRSVDAHGRSGPFCEPGPIILQKK